MSADDPKAAPAGGARPRVAAYPRIAAVLSVGVAAHDRRSGASLRSATIGGGPRFEPAATKERRGPGELGPMRDSDRPRPPRPRRPPGLPAEESEAASPAGAAAAARGREGNAEGHPAPGAGMVGFPGFGVHLGELGSPAKPGADAGSSGGLPPAGFLGARLRAVPSLVDVSVSIGGDPGRSRGASRWTAPLRALAAKRSSRAATSGAAAPSTAVATRSAARVAAAAVPAAALPAELAPADATAPSRPGGLRRATRYVVNGILDIAIRRFRAGSLPGRG